MVTFPPCKINLGLHVIRKRADGYHDIETCFYPVPWTDILEIIPSNELAFTQSGLFIPGGEESNLCLKAYRLLQEDFHLAPVKIHLHKIIPIGAGLGGGSSDATHTLRLLNSVFQLQLAPDNLSYYASRLGSDCSFFIHDKPMLGTGRGDILHPVNVHLKNKLLVLVSSGIHVSTEEAYAGVSPAEPQSLIRPITEKLPVHLWKEFLVNDFERSVFQQHPYLRDIKERLYSLGALYASMSGSGSAVFGIFNKETFVKDDFKDCVCWSGLLP